MKHRFTTTKVISGVATQFNAAVFDSQIVIMAPNEAALTDYLSAFGLKYDPAKFERVTMAKLPSTLTP